MDRDRENLRTGTILVRAWLIFVLGIMLLGGAAAGAEPVVESTGTQPAAEMSGLQSGLGPLDWGVIALYGAFMLGVGWFYHRRQTTAEEYFLGNRSMGSIVVGISTYATLLSTISYLANPGEMIKHGPVILWGMAAIPVTYVIVGYLLIPALTRVRITSAYELLEERLGYRVRLLGGVIFSLTRLVWMALLVYLAAKALVTVVDWPQAAVPYVIVTAGLVAVVYTFLGGLRAVIITDVFQFFILMAGAVLTIGFVTVKIGGLGWWPTEWAPNWDHQPLFSWDPRIRVTVFGTLVSTVLWWVCTAGSDQVVIQRYLATRNSTAARRSFLVNGVAEILITTLLCLVGFALLGFYQANPQFLTEGRNLVVDADYLFPHFVANFLPAGIAGLVVAAMFAAAMSSLDSGTNSIVTVVTRDLLPRLRKGREAGRNELRVAKSLVLGIGIAVVLISSQMGRVPGNIFEVTNKTNGLFVGPLFGLFVLALFVPGANGFGAAFGALYGFLAAVLIAYWDVLTGREGLSFQWIILVALVVHIVIGVVLSRISARWPLGSGRIVVYVVAAAPPVATVCWMVAG
jgi:SSS family solute:Na+ symporter